MISIVVSLCKVLLSQKKKRRCSAIPVFLFCFVLGHSHLTSSSFVKSCNIINGHYLYMQDLVDIENHQEPGSFPLWPLCPSPICLANWLQFLHSHPDKRFSLYIERGFQKEFQVGLIDRPLFSNQQQITMVQH